MQSVFFEGSKEIKKPKNMTDEECTSAYALDIKVPAGKDERGNDLFSTIWIEHIMPTEKDLEALNAGRGFWIQLHCGPRLIPIAVLTLNENGDSNAII